MKAYETLINNHDGFVFDLDDVIYPKKDFLLQVYYLFAQFIEYTEQLEAAPIIEFMKKTYHELGETEVFEKTIERFHLEDKYRLNFDLLLSNARLPLKLLLFENVKQFLKAVIAANKPIFLLISGNPETQLNKIRQIEWEGLASELLVFFKEEIQISPEESGLSYIINHHNLTASNILILDCVNCKMNFDFNANVNFLQANKLYPSELRN
jgi:hypothetical protein